MQEKLNSRNGFIGICVVLTILFALTFTYEWQGFAELHTVMEVAAMLIGFSAGVAAFLRYFSQKRDTILFVATGILGTAFLDGYHAAVTSVFLRDYLPSDIIDLIPWSWVASRFYFSLFMTLAVVAFEQEKRTGISIIPNERKVFWAAVGLAVFCFVLFAMLPLPRAGYPELFFHRPEEFLPAAFFVYAFVGFYKRGEWRTDIFEFWLVAALLVNIFSEAVFMPFSNSLFDTMFDIAHSLKNISYAMIAWGLMWSTYELFVESERNKVDITNSNKNLLVEARKRRLVELRIRKSEERLRVVMDNAPAAIFLQDPNGKYLLANQEFENLTNKTEAELLGKTDLECLSETMAKAFSGNIRTAQETKKSCVSEAEIVLSETEKHTFIYSTSPILNEKGEVEMICGVATDITARKKAEIALTEYAQDLERSNQELDDFAYIASHDLKEPLRGIHNYSAFLIEDYGSQFDDEGKHKLETLLRLTIRLEELINQLLYYSRVGRDELEIKPIKLDDIIAGVKEDLVGRLEELNGNIVVPNLIGNHFCDAIKIREVFQNLITNALKYNSSENPTIEIGIRPADETTEKAPVFYVKDNGIGMRQRHIDSIFTIFKRLHGRDKFGGGTGIGLTIVKKIVERHGGKVWVESVYNEGSTFLFTLKK